MAKVESPESKMAWLDSALENLASYLSSPEDEIWFRDFENLMERIRAHSKVETVAESWHRWASCPKSVLGLADNAVENRSRMAVTIMKPKLSLNAAFFAPRCARVCQREHFHPSAATIRAIRYL
jgi:hypothetical protein